MKAVFAIAAGALIVTNLIVIYRLNEVQKKITPVADDVQGILDKLKAAGIFG